MHYVYRSWKFTSELLQQLVTAIVEYTKSGKFSDPLANTSAKAVPFEDTSNKKPKKIRNINCNRNMNKKLIRLTESDLHRIVKKSVNKVLKEGIGQTDPKELSYRLMVMLGEIQNELNRSDEPVTLDEIDELYGMASKLNAHFEDSAY